MMSHVNYTEENLLEIGRTNYKKLVLYCKNLELTGFWDQARQVMNQSSTEVLDLYVQSVLMNLAIHCGKVLDNQKEFIRQITGSNPLGIEPEGEIDQQTVEDSIRFYQFPPILLQLCGLYDKQDHKDMAEYFLDSLLNILLCMAYLNDGRDGRVNQFIQEYYNKVCIFVDQRDESDHSRYIFHKLSSDKIQCDVQWLHEKKQEVAAAAGSGTELEELCQDEDASDEVDESSEHKTQEPEEMENSVSQSQDTEKNNDGEQEEEELAREQFQRVKKRLQEREQAEQEAREKRIQDLVGQLNGLVGLSGVKEEIRSLINLIKIRSLREKMNMPSMEMSYHMVFTGAPGTGKTTVARLVAKIYKELGILSEGTVIETDRSGLVAGYVGQTAMKVHEIVDQAIGGVLFIDEAYSLVNPDVPNDFGTEAVDTLVKLMEDHRDNLVIIVAGYTEEMKRFLKSNTGLISRFNKFIDFPDYCTEELVQIMEVMAGQAGLHMEESATGKVVQWLQHMSQRDRQEFGNARGIRNMFEKIVMNQANRLVLLEKPSREELMTIVKEDIKFV